MNEELERHELARRLEQATAVEPHSELDPEASAWREGWTTWGKLLDTDNAVDDKALDRLLNIPKDSGIAEVQKSPTRLRRPWGRYASVASAALAVSLLLAIAARFSPVVEPPEDAKQGSSDNSLANHPFARRQLAWDDTWDFRVARVETQLVLAQYDSVSLGSSFDTVRFQVGSVRKEIEEDPL